MLSGLLHQRSITDQEANYLAQAANASLHYSQEGEDIILERLFGSQEKGFFVDVGAHHPTRFSNTYSLYRKGWRGINIDATPDSMTAFFHKRPNDINIEAAVSDKTETMLFNMFKEPALNTFDSALADTYVKAGFEQQEKRNVNTQLLKDILDKYLPSDTKIDLMNIDVEGGELNVLKSNDWKKYSPMYIIIEVLDVNFSDIMAQPVPFFLGELGYVPITKLVQSLIMKKI